MKRVLVIGGSGQLGRCLQEEVRGFGDLSLDCPERSVCDVGKPRTGLREYLSGSSFDAVVNAAAYHDLRKCEEDFDRAFLVNAYGVRAILDHMPEECRLYTISTDYVFDGRRAFEPTATETGMGVTGYQPYDRWNPTRPLNNYGRTKRAGEILALASDRATIIRTASLFSRHGSRGKGGSNFVLQMLDRAKGEGHIGVVSDVTMSPTYTPHLARAILWMIQEEVRPPLAHIVSEGPPVSWFEFAEAIFEVGEMPEAAARLVPKACEDWPPRPRYSALANSISRLRMGTWREGLEDFFAYRWRPGARE